MKQLFVLLIFTLSLLPTTSFAQSPQASKIEQLKEQTKTINQYATIRVKLNSGKTIEGDCNNCFHNTIQSDYISIKDNDTRQDCNIKFTDIDEIQLGPSFNTKFKRDAELILAGVVITVTIPYTLITGRSVIQQ